MCKDCGCQQANASYFPKSDKVVINVEQQVLEKNHHIAHHNRHWFEDHKLRVLNLMSSPGSGKTSLLEKTVEELSATINFATLVGDQQTDHDAKRLERLGALVNQITTHSSCHLDASMIAKELDSQKYSEVDLLFIENVGNLVCPAAFELGEDKVVALLSCTEGEDKPLKYPVLFNKADLIIITKTDLRPYLDWDESLCLSYIRRVNPKAKVIQLSAKTGEGMNQWYEYLKEQVCV